jgi:hypothetical protein
MVRWKSASGTPARNGLAASCLYGDAGRVAALRESRETLQRMWRGLEHC